MTNQNELINRLGKLGMSGYEAKAYLALVHASRPLNGYEVSKLSGVPRSTVYETLGKLVARGAAFETHAATDSVSYLPLPPNSLLSRISSEFDESLGILRRELLWLSSPRQTHLIHNIPGRSSVLERAVDVIQDSHRDVLVSIWPEELEELRPALKQAEARGAEITMLVFDDKVETVGYAYRHRYSSPEFVLSYLGYRLFVVVGDSKQSVMGGFQDSDGWGVYSDNPAVVMLSTEYVRHDIAMQIMGDHFGEQVVGEYVSSHPEFVRLRGVGGHGPATWTPEEESGTSRRRARKSAAKAAKPAPEASVQSIDPIARRGNAGNGNRRAAPS